MCPRRETSFSLLVLPSLQRLPLSCQSRRRSWYLSWPFLDPQNYVHGRATRNVSSFKKVLVVTLFIIFQRIQLSHKSLATCLHHVFVMETQLPALRWQNPADVTSALFELMTSKQVLCLRVHLWLHSLTWPLLLTYYPPRNCGLVGRRTRNKKTQPQTVTSKGNTRGKVPWIPIAKTHTTWKEERKENPIWDFKRKVEHAHTILFGKGAQAGKYCSSSMLCSEKVLMVQPSCIITHKQERPCRTVGVF